jgi:serralysin
MIALLLMSLMGAMSFVLTIETDSEPYDPNPDGMLEPPDDVDGLVMQSGQNSTFIEGSDQDDWIAAGRSCDTVDGGAGDDTIFGERGRDMLHGEDGNDLLNGGAWHDVLDGGAGTDTLLGETGQDTLSGGEGDDLLDGGSWDDLLVGGAGADVLFGGNGDDILVGHVIDTGDGNTTDISARAYHETLELGYDSRGSYEAMTPAEQETFLSDALEQMNALYPGLEAGNDAGDTMHGGQGNDAIYLTHDDDLAYGGSGDDRFVLTEWSDHLATGDDLAPQVADYGTGSDVLVVEYLAAEGGTAPAITVDTLENGDQLVRANGTAIVHLSAPVIAVTASDINLIAIEPAA